jgi:hypothetical protein
MGLKAGTGRRDISNRKPLFLVGYPHVERISEGIHDPLLATALYLGDGANRILSIAVDILFVDHDTARACREAISERTGIPVDHILISATHTHSGPVTCKILSWRDDDMVPGPDPDYMNQFTEGIVEAAVEAYESATDADVAVTSARSEGVGGNRLAKDGTRDPEVGVVFVRRRSDGSPLALQMVYSMHPTVLHEDTKLVSSDFPHYTRALLESRFPGMRVLYHNGPCGNLSPRYWVSGQTFAEAERLGEMLGRDVVAAVEGLSGGAFQEDVSIGGATCRVGLPPRTFCSVAEAERELAEARAEFDRLKREGAPHGPVRTAECTVFGAEERVTLARAQEKGDTMRILEAYNPAEIQVLRVGDHYLVGFPGECFVEYALEVKRRCPGAFVISLANGELQGYIPTPEATGYEARLSFFEPEAGDRLVDAAEAVIRERL